VQSAEMEHRDIPVELLEAHPENTNFMNDDMLRKLRRHIERTGRYESIVVRPHPYQEGRFQVINGHNRLRVLRALNCQTAHCVVWNLDDGQTRLYLATLNRLSGRDIPERRAALLESLLATFDVGDLTTLLPDDRKQLEELQRLSHIEVGEAATARTCRADLAAPVIMTFMLEESGASEVNLALDMLIHVAKEDTARGQALVRLAQFYLGNIKAVPLE